MHSDLFDAPGVDIIYKASPAADGGAVTNKEKHNNVSIFKAMVSGKR
jgi:hypothetical protein